MKTPKYFKWRKRGIEIDDFLNDEKYAKQREMLKNARVFYVIRPNSEKVFKIGISGMHDGNGIGRLREYQLYYGNSDGKCSGAKIHFLGRTKYDPDVAQKNSEIYKRELFVKRYLKQQNVLERGRERTSASIDAIEGIMNLYDDGPDLKTDKRRSTRTTRGIINTYRPEPTAKDVPKNFVGRFILKDFNGKVHLGLIDSVGPAIGDDDGTDDKKDDNQIFANVLYDDGDREQLDFKEVNKTMLSELEVKFREPQLIELFEKNRKWWLKKPKFLM